MIWTPAMVARLKSLHSDGLSSGQVANRMTVDFGRKVTRSAAIGKAWRLGLRFKRRV